MYAGVGQSGGRGTRGNDAGLSTEIRNQIKEDLWNRQLDGFRSVGPRAAISRVPRAQDDEPTTIHRHATLAGGRPIEL